MIKKSSRSCAYAPLRGRARCALPPPADDLRIERIGADGDGIATRPDGTSFYIAGTLPGELVRAQPIVRRGEGWAAEALTIAGHSPERASPPCPHFGACGGCALQHWRDDAYLDWKSGLLRAALARAGFPDAPVGPISQSPAGSRRRVDLALNRAAGKVQVGLHRRRSADIVDLQSCVVLDPSLVDLIAPLRAVLVPLSALRRSGSAIVNLLDTGADLLLRTDADITTADRTALTGFAAAHELSRIAWARANGEPEAVCVLRPPVVSLSSVTVSPPPGAFLQATVAAERAIVAAVLAGLPETLPARSRIVELFAGCGTLTFPLAAHARVIAFEADEAAAASLRRAAAGRPIAVVARDLARQPLGAEELAGAAAIVLDPPYAGAAPQMPALAASRVPRIVYASCNPATLARDARSLRDAGYEVLAATPIDQFRWSARLESVVAFGRSFERSCTSVRCIVGTRTVQASSAVTPSNLRPPARIASTCSGQGSISVTS